MKEEIKQVTGETEQAARTLLFLFAGRGRGGGGVRLARGFSRRNGKMRLIDFPRNPGNARQGKT